MFRASRQADLSGNLCYIADGISGLVWRNVTRVWRGRLSTQLFRGCWWNFCRVETKARRDQNESSARGIRDAVSACKWIVPRPPSFSFSSISQPLWINLVEILVNYRMDRTRKKLIFSEIVDVRKNLNSNLSLDRRILSPKATNAIP